MRRLFATLAASALALTFTTGAFAAGKDDGPPYTMNKTGCLDVHNHLVAKTKCDTPAAATGKKAPNCSKGKPCGETCIAKDKVCHIK